MKYIKLFENINNFTFTRNIEEVFKGFSNERVVSKIRSLLFKDILNNSEIEKPKTFSNLNTSDKLNYLISNFPQLIDDLYISKLTSISDFISSDTNNISVYKTFNDLYLKSDEWHSKGESIYLSNRTDETSKTDKFIQYLNGWYWINLNTDFSEDEKNNMGHCGKDSGKILFSLRDDMKQSHITASYSFSEKALYQIKGRSNSKPKPIYHQYIIDMILNSKYPINLMITGGYKPELDFNLMDLTEKDRKMLLDKKPSLEYTNKMFEYYLENKDWLKIIAMINNGFVYNGYKRIDKNDLNPFLDLVKKQKASVNGLESFLGFVKACSDGNLEVVKLLIENGADVTGKNNLAIKLASQNGNLEVVKYLIDNGADVTAEDNQAIRMASQNGHLEIVKLLIENGADVTAQNNYAIRWASHNGNLETVKYLIENGADVTAQNNYAIRWASGNGYLEILKLLIDNGADVTANDNYAIRNASFNGHLEVVKLLIENGADVTAEDNQAIIWASGNGYLEIVNLLIDNGADVTTEDNQAIRLASQNGHLEVVKLLIENGADVTAKDNYAIRYASQNGHLEIVKLLKKHGAVLESFKIKNWKQFNS